MSFVIFYGIKENKNNVTTICINKLKKNNIIIIPQGGNERAFFFNDHLPGIHKSVFVVINNKEVEYDEYHEIHINVNEFTTHVIKNTEDVIKKISHFHNTLTLRHGLFEEELPEQKMAVKYLTGNEKVLELGSNIGRNSLIIGSIVKNNNFVSLEPDYNIFKILEDNRNINNLSFHIENLALSKQKLIQRGWETKPSDILEEGYKWVNILNFDELQNKYKIDFDTLILDCEGAFYFILKDSPEILNNIKLIIMENDYIDINHKIYINSILKQYNFFNVYTEGGGWGCCANNFFEVWKK
jgi:FkbM family methyltransferase